MLMTLGNLGIGAAWGWLIGLIVGRDPKPWSTTLKLIYSFALFAATGSIAAVVVAFADGVQAVYFGLSAFFFMCLHIGWLTYLRQAKSS